jgi:hypothetical protein
VCPIPPTRTFVSTPTYALRPQVVDVSAVVDDAKKSAN